MQHLDRRFKHLDELHNPLVGAAQGAGVAVGVRIVLGIMLQFTNIHFTDQRGDILVILITRFGLGDGNLLKDRGPHFDHAEFGDVATELMQAFCRPRRHNGAEITGRHAILFIENLRVFLRVKQAQRMIVDRATFTVGAQDIDRHTLH